MSFRINQKVGKHTYVYEVESYWDKSKKQPRQKRTYIGKKDPISGELISTHRGYLSLDYGNSYFLHEIAKQLDLHILLKQIFPDIWQAILTCIYFEISEKKALYLCKPWMEYTYNIAEKDLSSQRISELLNDLGQNEEARVKNPPPKEVALGMPLKGAVFLIRLFVAARSLPGTYRVALYSLSTEQLRLSNTR